jgi:hypothetical protein
MLLLLCGMCASIVVGIPLPVRWGSQESPEADLTESDGFTDKSCLELNMWKKRQQ